MFITNSTRTDSSCFSDTPLLAAGFFIQFGCRSLVVVGSATNFAVLYTATTAARIYRYDVIVPLDGVNAKRRYEHEYAIHQLTILPASAHKQFRFTTLGMIEFH